MRVAASHVLHRLFFALVPPKRASHRMRLLRDDLPLTDKVRVDRFHMTLGIGEDCPAFDPQTAEAMRKIGDEVAGEPQRIVLDCMAGSNASVALRPAHAVPGLRILQSEIGERMLRRGLARRKWRFNPHVTLGYRDGVPFRKPVSPVEWEACDFVLIHSVVGRTIHRELRRWPLRPRQYPLPFA